MKSGRWYSGCLGGKVKSKTKKRNKQSKVGQINLYSCSLKRGQLIWLLVSGRDDL